MRAQYHEIVPEPSLAVQRHQAGAGTVKSHLAGARTEGPQESIETWTIKKCYTSIIWNFRETEESPLASLPLSCQILSNDFHCLNSEASAKTSDKCNM